MIYKESLIAKHSKFTHLTQHVVFPVSAASKFECSVIYKLPSLFSCIMYKNTVR